MEASGYPSQCDTDQEKTSTLNVYESTKELLCVQMTFHSMQDVVQSLNFASIISGGNFAQTPDRTIKEFITEPRGFYHLLSDDGFEVSDGHHVNDDCLYVSYKKSKEFQTPALNTNVIIASYVTTHARLYSYLEQLKERALVL